ncbi:MAG: PQQ-binding-like beta-propeller repeat protein [bacterium]|nr:PQQ-binding-like beta-propeller repeat protein [bacterium]
MFARRTGMWTTLSLLLVSAFAAGAADGEISPTARGRAIMDEADVRGGLVVHVGCADGELTAALRVNDRYVVQGLERDPALVSEARNALAARGLTGPISVAHWEGKRLPYAENLVNLLVVERPDAVGMDEVMRVLAPGGVAMLRGADGWSKASKPWPGSIDEWTHYLHDETNNAVADDAVVGPPRHAQWIAEPWSARSHEHLASVSAIVSSGGRVFCIADLGPVASVTLKSDWRLLARDAFSGVQLWEKPVGPWENQLRGFRTGPSDMARRLVAVGNRVYATLGYGKGAVALDAATGEEVRHFSGTEGAEELMVHDGLLFVVVGDVQAKLDAAAAARRGALPPEGARRLMVFDAMSGEERWREDGKDVAALMPTTLAGLDTRVYFQNLDGLICLDAASGEERWRVARPVSASRPSWSAPTLVVHDGVVLCADREGPKEPNPAADAPRYMVDIKGGGISGQLIAYDAATGERLWQCPCMEGYNSSVDVFVADGLVWTGKVRREGDPGFTEGRDLRTGEVVRRIASDEDHKHVGMPHHRCYRNKATNDWLLMGKSGIEFIDIETGETTLHNWVRGVCQYGIMPCNGMIYAGAHSCACHIAAKLNGFCALAPEQAPVAADDAPRMNKGAAYDEPLDAKTDEDAWPTLRQNAMRSGATANVLPTSLRPAWETELGGGLSSVSVAEGRVYVASIDSHVLHALDVETGEEVWQCVAAGRVDSPPTICKGRAYFGSADGHVYCVRASDGAPVWRFRAAPESRRMVAGDQVESTWPVHGTVLVEDGVVYAAAGRSSFLDGGIALCRLDAETGKLLSETRVFDMDPNTGSHPWSKSFTMEGAFPDVLSSDGTSVFMRHRRFDRAGVEQEQDVPHIFSPTGFLDGSWWHRTYWQYGDKFPAGWGNWWKAGNMVPAGRILAVNETHIYGFGRSFYPSGNAGQWNHGEKYRLFAIGKDFDPLDAAAVKRRGGNADKDRPSLAYQWERTLPFFVRAMVLAQDTLFIAGPPDAGHTSEEALASLRGERGALLWAVSAADGAQLAEMEMDSPPVFDGMAVAYGRIYMTTMDGRVVCMAGREE